MSRISIENNNPTDAITYIKLLTETEVAALIRKSVHWLRRKRWEGGNDSIPYRKLGASVRYAENDVFYYIAQHALRISTSDNGGI